MSLSAADVKYELESLRPNLFLDETEDSWEKIGKSIASLSKICENGGYDANPVELVTALRSAHRPITSAMNSERTRLSLIPLELFTTLASVMGGEFEQLLPLFMQPLLNLCTRTNKVVLNRARACILSIIECSQSASLLTYFLHNIKDKSNTLKVVASEGTLACLNSCNPPDLEKESRAIEIEAIIRATARDANADVRKVSRKLFKSYKILLPSRVPSFTAPLSPTTKKYLDIKAAPVNSKPVSTMRSTGQVKPQIKPEIKVSKPSSSTSTTSTARPGASRSVSSTLSMATIANQTRKAAVTMTRVARKEPVEGSGAPSAPVRSFQPTRATDASKTTTQRMTSTTTASGPMRATVSQDQSRPLPPGRSQASTVSRVAGAGSNPSMGAHRLQLNSAPTVAATSEAQSIFSGPRRVPMPASAPPPAPASLAAKEKEVSKAPISRAGSAASVKPRSVPAAPVKSKPAATLPSIKDRLPTSSLAQSKSRPVSSTSNAAASSSNATSSTTTRPLTIAAKAKPQWGRTVAPVKLAPGPQKASAATLARKPSTRILPRAAAPAPVMKRPVTPAMVALPPSPTPKDSEAAAENVTAPPENIEIQPKKEFDETEKSLDACQVISSMPPSDAPQEQQIKEVIVASTEDGDVADAAPAGDLSEDSDEHDGRTSPSPEHGSQGGSSTVTPSDKGPQTPQGLLPLPLSSQAAYTAKTPISALLSSIEHGFTYSPITPLSPAELYLPNDNGSTPYSHQSHSQGPRQAFNYALHAPDAHGMFGGFAYNGNAKREEELVCGDIGVIKVSDHNKLFSQLGMDDGTQRHAFLELNQ